MGFERPKQFSPEEANIFEEQKKNVEKLIKGGAKPEFNENLQLKNLHVTKEQESEAKDQMNRYIGAKEKKEALNQKNKNCLLMKLLW